MRHRGRPLAGGRPRLRGVREVSRSAGARGADISAVPAAASAGRRARARACAHRPKWLRLRATAIGAINRAAELLRSPDRSDALGAVLHDQPRMALGYLAEIEAELWKARRALEEWR